MRCYSPLGFKSRDLWAVFGAAPNSESAGAANMKKLILAVVVSFAFLMATNYVIHGVWLTPDYNAIPASHRTAAEIQQKFWVLAIGQILFAAMFAYIYTRGIERKPWLAQGLRYGVVMTLVTVLPYSLSEYDTYIIPHMLAIKWIAAGALQLIVLGAIVAGIYKSQTV
jgi:hypothetical protein